jgi:two-component system nitrogen regulation response regulator GlnG/two-component system response regulator HydG
MDDDLNTVTDLPADPKSGPASPSAPETLALVTAWADGEPERLGETWLPSTAWSIFGRGGGSPADPHPRLSPVRIRPGRVDAGPPLENPRVSRVQMRLRIDRQESIAFERLGRTPLLRGSAPQPADCGALRPGDTLQVGAQLLLLVVRRRSWLPTLGDASLLPDFPFGAADRWGLVGEAPEMWSLRERIAFAAARREHVLISGASGVGKELVARALHESSSTRPLIARNAATFPETLIDAELFGNARNYPNAGMAERRGLIGEADGGTLFLDEFAELPRALQVHLLRVLDEGDYQRLGDSQVRRARFRLLAATNRPVTEIRHDLLGRFPLRIEVPALDRRTEDVPLIARHLLRDLAPGEPRQQPPLSLMRSLLGRHYTANVRELRALLLEWLSRRLHGSDLACRGSAETEAVAELPAVEHVFAARLDDRATNLAPERLQAALDDHRGHIESARRQLGLSSRHVLARLIVRHRLRAGRAWRPRPGDGE